MLAPFNNHENENKQKFVSGFRFELASHGTKKDDLYKVIMTT